MFIRVCINLQKFLRQSALGWFFPIWCGEVAYKVWCPKRSILVHMVNFIEKIRTVPHFVRHFPTPNGKNINLSADWYSNFCEILHTLLFIYIKWKVKNEMSYFLRLFPLPTRYSLEINLSNRCSLKKSFPVNSHYLYAKAMTCLLPSSEIPTVFRKQATEREQNMLRQINWNWKKLL